MTTTPKKDQCCAACRKVWFDPLRRGEIYERYCADFDCSCHQLPTRIAEVHVGIDWDYNPSGKQPPTKTLREEVAVHVMDWELHGDSLKTADDIISLVRESVLDEIGKALPTEEEEQPYHQWPEAWNSYREHMLRVIAALRTKDTH